MARKKYSEQAIENIIAGAKNRKKRGPCSEETKAKIRAAQIGKPCPQRRSKDKGPRKRRTKLELGQTYKTDRGLQLAEARISALELEQARLPEEDLEPLYGHTETGKARPVYPLPLENPVAFDPDNPSDFFVKIQEQIKNQYKRYCPACDQMCCICVKVRTGKMGPNHVFSPLNRHMDGCNEDLRHKEYINEENPYISEIKK